MLKLHGIPISNYTNMVKVCLIEKGLEFEEVKTPPSQEDGFLQMSPMGKVPCLETDQGYLSETYAIIDYIDHIQPEPPLFPSDPYQRAKVIELIRYIELHIELVARRCLPAAFFGASVSEDTKKEVSRDLKRGVAALKKLLVCDPYAAGDSPTLADVYVVFSFPLAAQVVQKVLDEDLLIELPEVKSLLERLSKRESVKRVEADRQAAMGG